MGRAQIAFQSLFVFQIGPLGANSRRWRAFRLAPRVWRHFQPDRALLPVQRLERCFVAVELPAATVHDALVDRPTPEAPQGVEPAQAAPEHCNASSALAQTSSGRRHIHRRCSLSNLFPKTGPQWRKIGRIRFQVMLVRCLMRYMEYRTRKEPSPLCVP